MEEVFRSRINTDGYDSIGGGQYCQKDFSSKRTRTKTRRYYNPPMSHLTVGSGARKSVKPSSSYTIYLLVCYFLFAGCIQHVSCEDCSCSPRVASLKNQQRAFEKVLFEDWDQFRLKRRSILDSVDLPKCKCLSPKKFERIPFKDWDQFRLKRSLELAGDSSNSKQKDPGSQSDTNKRQVYYWTPYKRQRAYNMWRKGKRTSYRTISRAKSNMPSGPLFLSSTSSMASNAPLSQLSQKAAKLEKVHHPPEVDGGRGERAKSRTNSLRWLEKEKQRLFRRSSSRLSNFDDLGSSIGRFERSLFNYPSHKRLRQWRKGS